MAGVVNFVLDTDFEGLRGEVQWNGFQQRLKLNGSDVIPSFNWIDFAMSYKLQEKARLTVGVNNVLDKEPPLGAGFSDVDYGRASTARTTR